MFSPIADGRMTLIGCLLACDSLRGIYACAYMYTPAEIAFRSEWRQLLLGRFLEQRDGTCKMTFVDCLLASGVTADCGAQTLA